MSDVLNDRDFALIAAQSQLHQHYFICGIPVEASTGFMRGWHARDLTAGEREDVLTCWVELWKGTIASQRTFMSLTPKTEDQSIVWILSPG